MNGEVKEDMSHHNPQHFNVNEYCSWILSQGSPHNCIIAAGVNGQVDFERLKRAVQSASREQLMLRFSIAQNICEFVPICGSIPVRRETHEADWRIVAENELATPFLDREVLARITWVNSGELDYIVLCFHHVIGDGTSGTQFLLRIINLYNDPGSAAVLDETHINIPVPNNQSIFVNNYPTQYTTKIADIFIDAGIVHAIENNAIKLGHSLNAHFSGALLKAALALFDVPRFHVSMAVDLRREYPMQGFPTLKFLTSWIDFQCAPSRDGFVESIQSNIRQCLKAKQHHTNLTALNDKINSRTDNAGFAKDFRSHQPTICITNSGTIDDITMTCNQKNALKLVELHLSVNVQSYMGTPDSLTVQLNCLKGKGLFIKINYPDPLVSSVKISELAVYFQKALLT